VKPKFADRFIDSIEFLAALFVGIVAADVFVSVLLRYFFGVSIPDSYDFGRLLLGVLIFWGIGATSYRGTHITVDLLYANVGARYQRAIDVFATLVLLFVVAARRQRAHFRSAAADLAILRAGLDRRRLGGDPDCAAHLPADLSS